ncbi:MAG: menaquinone biosynthetic enzyme MqnA/MqnD family protein [Phycisphaeraceae bacterium]
MGARPDSSTRLHRTTAATPAARCVGCVSYLNAKPLIEGLDEIGDEAARPQVRYDVPARLLADLESGEVTIALCPVIDYFRAARPLAIVPAGGIGCMGRTLTVRLFSRVPIERIDAIHADTDSHTSVALLRVLLAEMHNIQPELIDYHAREHVAGHRLADAPEAMLLIGDKVVTDSPLAAAYPHQLDLGEAWHQLTGLPFVFAVWMALRGAELGDLPQRLVTVRQRNGARIATIVDRYAQRHGWPRDLATEYLRDILRFAVGDRELTAIRRFADLAARHGLIEEARPLSMHPIHEDKRE